MSNRDEERRAAAEIAWWAWHDADASRFSTGDEEGDGAVADAEARCEAWVIGESDDGPPVRDPAEEAAYAADRAYDQAKDDALTGDR